MDDVTQPTGGPTWTIADLADEYGVTLRTIRH